MRQFPRLTFTCVSNLQTGPKTEFGLMSFSEYSKNTLFEVPRHCLLSLFITRVGDLSVKVIYLETNQKSNSADSDSQRVGVSIKPGLNSNFAFSSIELEQWLLSLKPPP